MLKSQAWLEQRERYSPRLRCMRDTAVMPALFCLPSEELTKGTVLPHIPLMISVRWQTSTPRLCLHLEAC